jgi:hypothetical protein
MISASRFYKHPQLILTLPKQETRNGQLKERPLRVFARLQANNYYHALFSQLPNIFFNL